MRDGKAAAAAGLYIKKIHAHIPQTVKFPIKTDTRGWSQQLGCPGLVRRLQTPFPTDKSIVRTSPRSPPTPKYLCKAPVRSFPGCRFPPSPLSLPSLIAKRGAGEGKGVSPLTYFSDRNERPAARTANLPPSQAWVPPHSTEGRVLPGQRGWNPPGTPPTSPDSGVCVCHVGERLPTYYPPRFLGCLSGLPYPGRGSHRLRSKLPRRG